MSKDASPFLKIYYLKFVSFSPIFAIKNKLPGFSISKRFFNANTF